MIQKIIRVGSSAAVVLNKDYLEKLGLAIGDKIEISFNSRQRVLAVKATEDLGEDDLKIARLALNFMAKYKKDFTALARK